MSEFKLYPEPRHWWSLLDYGAVLAVVERLKPATVLEFGPGNSTLALIEGGAGHIDGAEDDPKWRAIYQARIADVYPDRVELFGYTMADPVSIPAIDGRRYDLALIDGPRNTELRPLVIEYCIARCARVLIPLEEAAGIPAHLRPIVLAIAQTHNCAVELIESGPLAGTFALLTT